MFRARFPAFERCGLSPLGIDLNKHLIYQLRALAWRVAEFEANGKIRNMSSSIYERLGGEAAVDAAVDIFYRKVLADERISSFFDDVDMDRQRAKQKAFLTFAFGGPSNYGGKDMKAAHAHMKISEKHFNAVMENLAATLSELGVPEALIGEAATIALSVKGDIVSH
ncbi:MAG TPA: group 1 truncated hemoglobin [Polyangiaceae bacterium]|nr:group 1 truncated hemoglobin [Polyangiaceae bacterium]